MNKGTLISVVTLLLLMILLPLFSLCSSGEDLRPFVTYTDVDYDFTVYDPKTDTVNGYSAQDYVFGVVAAEMDINYHDEALKAQAVSAYTLALYKKDMRAKKPDKSIKYADLSADYTKDQAFITREQAYEKWGNKASEYESKLDNIINLVKDKVIMYDGKIIQSVYHDTSSGKTESAENMWGSSIPYLVSVQSVGDLLNPHYVSSLSISYDEFSNKLSDYITNDVEKIKTTVNIAERTPSGTVTDFVVGDKHLTGKEIRSIFLLKSANFDIEFTASSVNFTVRGYGHGVGMSQYGANVMAQQGSDYQSILKWYYQGCEII